MQDDSVTQPPARPATLPHDPLLDARLRRTEYADHIMLTKKVSMDGATITLLKNASGLVPLIELGRRSGLSPAGTLDVARRLLEAGYLIRVEDGAPASRDPLTPEMRALVRRVRPILVRFAGEEAAFTLEVDAPHCKNLADLVVCMRRRFADPKVREQFTAAVMSEVQEPPRGTR